MPEISAFAEPELLPDPSPEAIMIAVSIHAYLADAPRKQRERYLERITSTLQMLDAAGVVVGIRTTERERATAKARTLARAWWDRVRIMM